MKFAVPILAISVMFMLAGALPAKGGGQLAVFRTPVFIAVMALLVGSLVHCSLRRFKWRQLGFLFTHLGVALVLSGAFLGFFLGRKTQFAAPISAEHAVKELPGPDQKTTFTLPFELAVTHFDVEFYPPVYHLYLPPERGDPVQEPSPEYVYERDVHVVVDNDLDLDEGDRINAATLQDEQGNWVRQYVLPSGKLLQMGDPTPKHFRAVVRVTDDDGDSRTEPLAVNHPFSHRGWRFYLMSYDREAQRYVWLSARRDPGRRLVISGIWGIILGVAWLCWRPAKGAARAES